MAEHELCKLGVTGSTPVASTMLRSERSVELSMPCEALAKQGVPACRGALVGNGRHASR